MTCEAHMNITVSPESVSASQTEQSAALKNIKSDEIIYKDKEKLKQETLEKSDENFKVDFQYNAEGKLNMIIIEKIKVPGFSLWTRVKRDIKYYVKKVLKYNL